MNRRNFFKAGGAAALFAGTGSLLSGAPKSAGGGGRSKKARNVILLVSDGMSPGTFSFTDQFIRWRDGRPSNWMRLYEEGTARRGMLDTASLNSIVTDSAAAGSSWGCGKRVNNGAVNMGPNGEEHTPILVLAKEAGKSTGLVTTATATHATPAGFAANVASRNEEPKIATQYLEREIDIILGGGLPFFKSESREDGRDLLGEYKSAGYACVLNTEELRKAAKGNSPILGLFANGNIPFELDRVNSDTLKESVPSLAEMTRVSLNHLNKNRNGFVLQVEGARIDHGAHSNDIGAVLFDQIAFDDALGVVADFVKENPDTLVIVTTDHGNANPGLNSGWNGGENNFSIISNMRGTHEAILSKIDAETSPEAIREVIQTVARIEVSEENARLLRDRLNEEFRMPYHRMNTPNAVLGQILANHTDIGWVGTSHTSDHVELAAFGPGSESVRAVMKNYELFGVMTESLGISATSSSKRVAKSAAAPSEPAAVA